MTQGWTCIFEQLENHLIKLTMKIEPYLFFEGRAEEAIEFYKKAVSAEVVMMMRFKESPDTSGCPPGPGMGEKIMHATLSIGSTQVMMSDGRCESNPKFEGFALSISAANPAEAEKLYKALGDKGEIVMPLTKTFFSPAFGMLRDRFGVHWMVIVPVPMP
jgi:PhnB protein